MGLLTDGGWVGRRGGKKAHATMMKLGTVIYYLKKTQKIYKLRNTPLEF